MLGGLDTPTQGSVLFDGENIRTKGLEYHRKNHISLIFQSYNLIDYMTPMENVQLTARLDAGPILERLGLARDEITRNVLKLSGGQQQRGAIARALASDAPVILVVTHSNHVAKQADVVLEIKRGQLIEREMS